MHTIYGSDYMLLLGVTASTRSSQTASFHTMLYSCVNTTCHLSTGTFTNIP